jgi:hypothetical protein
MSSSLSTAARLASFHADRSVLYRALAYVIGAPANERTRSIARGILGEMRGESLSKDALDAALDAKMSLEDNLSLYEPCATGCERVRQQAFEAAHRTHADSPGSEAEVLSSLAGASAHALLENDLTEAAKLADLQYRFIEEHAAFCLTALASQLKEKGAPYPQMVARAIELMIESDLRLLGAW